MNARAPAMTFWFDFASTYAYLALMALEDRASAVGVAVRWRPFLLGPVFAAQGLDTSPFLALPAKGAFMWRDVARRAAAAGLPFNPAPPAFPIRSVEAGRRAIAALETPQGPAFCRAVSSAYWGAGRDIADPAVLDACATAVGLDPTALTARSVIVKAALRENTETAIAHGVFGAPSFQVGDELFWGADQMEDALAWARDGALAPRGQSTSGITGS